MSHEKIEVTVKRPWLFRAILVLLGAGAGAITSQAITPIRIVTTEKVVIVEKPVPVPTQCRDVNVNISRDIPATVKAPK